MTTRIKLSFRIAVPFVALLFGLVTPREGNSAEPLTINPESKTYDYYPASALAADGAVWLAWHGYRNGADQILARLVAQNGALGPVFRVSEQGRVDGPPSVAVGADDSLAVVWSTMIDDRWRVMLRFQTGGRWHKPQVLSGADGDAIHPTVRATPDGRLIVAWSESFNGRFQIRSCLINDRQPSENISVSNASLDAFRPQLVVRQNEAWVVWDQYQRPNYTIQARRILPQLGETERVSPPGQFCLKPVVTSLGETICVAWLRKVDVIGGPGVISQMHTLHAAIRKGQDWIPVVTSSGEAVAAELTHGLMAKIEPRVVATGGYLGPRTKPMLLVDGEQAWLLWERKSDHRGGTATIAGDLVARSMIDGKWTDEPVVLSRGRLDYHLVSHRSSGRPQMLASRLPRQGLRRYEMFELDMQLAERFEQDQWHGWAPVELPVRGEQTPQGEQSPRRTIRDGDKTYKLFWADLHCHNGLTADAEGEPDEMHAFARDRAALDVVVFTNNDFYNVPLTQYEYQLGNLFARVFSSRHSGGQGRLLSLPGYEWTSRIPGTPDASMDDPSNWLPPYQNRSYPNHRSVIYPPTGGPLVHFTEVGNDIAQLNRQVQQAGGITLSQHNNFKLSGHPVEVGFELTSGWSNYIASHPARFHGPLNAGARLGFTANGDTHRRAPGLSGALTAIYAESLSAEAVLDALRSRRCYATMGARIFVDARAGGALMGRQVTANEGRVELTLHAEGTRVIAAAVLIRDGEPIHRVEGNGTRQLVASFTDQDLTKGTHWYYWRVSQEGTAPVLPGNLMPAHGHLAWSTPNWVVVD